MIKLDTEFVSGVGGFSGPDVLTYKQLIRNDNYAVYERSRDGKVKDLEVIRIKVNPKGFQIFNGTPLSEDTEMYPSSGTWGKQGWSYHGVSAKSSAMWKYNQLINAVSVKEAEENEPVAELLLPVGEFTTRDVADKNNILYPVAALFIKESMESGLVKFVRTERRNTKGKESKIFIKSE